MSDQNLPAVANPFEGIQKPENAVSAIESSRAAQEVQAAVILAKKFPRNPVEATDRILAECQRYTLAEHAVYSFPRGGTQVSGPSIRLAEAMARAWGNCQYGVVELDRRGDESSMLAYAWDLESNTMARAEFKVRHYRDSNRGGKQALTEERDIYEAVANNGARRLRACILKLIPGDVTDAAVRQCDETIRAQIKDLGGAIARMVESFGKIGVTKEMVERRLRHRMEATNAAEVVALGRIFTSIQDGMSSSGDYFEAEAKEAPKTSTPEAARAAASKAARKPAAAPQEEIF